MIYDIVPLNEKYCLFIDKANDSASKMSFILIYIIWNGFLFIFWYYKMDQSEKKIACQMLKI